MRVIAGSLKGRRLKAPTWEGLRPTSDKLRETLFNILAARVAGARVLDGYAGTGAIGIEALSRGAARVTFVERDHRAAALIAENLAHCGVADGYAIIRADMPRALADWRAATSTFDAPIFDIVVLDPPYDRQLAADVAAVADVLAPDGLVVLEHDKRSAAPDHLQGETGRLVRSRDVVSGDSALTFYALSSPSV
jgi:16S rRNA (guanine966-N2)-methyltransferase